MLETGFKKYFSLDEAVALLPMVENALDKAHAEINALRDQVILHKRLIQMKKDHGMPLPDTDVMLLQEKFETFEQAMLGWNSYFAEMGIILRDLESGLIDFPYRSRQKEQDFLLCWRKGEEGIFYFHGLSEGFAGRHPITLLPE